MRCLTRTYKFSIKLNKKKDRDSPARAGGSAAHFLARVQLECDGDGSGVAQG
jgi:hypothetical protein